MSALTPFIVVAWLVAMIGIFPFLRHPRRAVLFIVISGQLFLPEAIPNHISLGPLHFEKYHSISYAALVGALLFDSGRLFTVRPTVIDLAAIAWCLCPLASSLTNDPPPDGGTSLKDGLVQSWTQIVSYGMPYLLGRMYFTNRDAFRDLGLGIITGALIYVPFCLFELKMSPQLHAIVYGYYQHNFSQTLRLGGYRPMVFMSHGLTLSLFMMSGTLFACLMWRGKELKGPLRYSPWVLGLTFVLLKSTGALVLGLVGAIAFVTSRLTNSRWPMLLLVTVPLLYVTVRTSGVWTGESLVQLITENFDADRAKSLEFRLKNEDLLVSQALKRPWFGWGGWSRSRVFDEEGKDLTVTDGLWVITLGDRGIIGLLALGGVLLLPVVRTAFLFSPSKSLQYGSITAAAYVLVLATIDSLPNVGIASPIYFMIAGGLAGLRLSPQFDPAWAEYAAQGYESLA